MAELTEAEAKWLKRVQRALNACPSSDIGFFTIGGKDVTLYRRPEVDFSDGRSDFCQLVDRADARLGELYFPEQVHSTAG